MVISVLFIGCEDEEIEAVDFSQKEKKREAKKEKSKSVQDKDGQEVGYVYKVENKRDPFKTYFEELVGQQEEQRSISELQRYELASLKLVGVVAGTATPMALMEDPTGKGHTIKIGSLVGKNFGQVKRIRRGEIDVQEEFRDFTGKRVRMVKTLKLLIREDIE